MWSNERLKLSLQNLFQEPSNVFTTSIIAQATLQYQKLMSLWESLSFTQATFLVVSITCWCLMIAMSLLGLFVARRRYGKPKRSVSSQFNPETAPGVSIIRPLKGVDCNLLENLASSFRQDYPVFEIIFSVANENDPAIEVAEKLMKRYPKVDARLIIAERDVGENPKINNLITPYEKAKYDVLWIKDSNIWVDPGCLSRSVEKLQLPGVGLVHHLPFATSPDTFGSELEMLFLDTVHAKMYLAINFLGPDSCVVGKSNIYRKSDVESVGGLAQFGKYMAEDNLIARALWRKGLKHEMTSDLAYQPLGSMATPDYFLRRSRWARIRKYTVTTATIIEPLTESILCGLLASYGFYTLWQIHPLNFLACHLIAWFMIDLSIFQTLSGKTLEVENLRGFIMAWTLREITALPLYIYSVVGDTVDWRDGTFRLLADSTVVRIPTQPQNNQRRLSFASLRIAANVNSTRNSNLKPWVVSIITSIILIIDIFMDVLFKSQRNGNPVECVTDSDMLKVVSRENLRRRKSQQRRRRIMRGESDEQNDIDNEPIGSENSADEREIDDPIIHAANRYLRNSLSRTRNYFFGISYDDEFEKEITDDPKSDTLESPSLHNKKKESPSHRRSVSLSNDSSSSSLNNLSKKTGATHTRHHSLLNEIFWGVSIGLSMHLQNEKNAIEGRRKRRYTSSSGADCSTNNTDERTRPRSLSIDL